MPFRTAALWESQHVALNSEILDTVPKLYVNREEQITLHLECRGTSNKSCQGAALLTIQVRDMKPLLFWVCWTWIMKAKQLNGCKNGSRRPNKFVRMY